MVRFSLALDLARPRGERAWTTEPKNDEDRAIASVSRDFGTSTSTSIKKRFKML